MSPLAASRGRKGQGRPPECSIKTSPRLRVGLSIERLPGCVRPRVLLSSAFTPSAYPGLLVKDQPRRASNAISPGEPKEEQESAEGAGEALRWRPALAQGRNGGVAGGTGAKVNTVLGHQGTGEPPEAQDTGMTEPGFHLQRIPPAAGS